MKSTLLFAGAAAATDYYGQYSAPESSSSSSKVGYTTVYPGYGKEPVTVTSQYQAVPTYVKNDKSTTGTWSDYAWVSTVIKDCDASYVTVTSTTQKVKIYHTKTTKTHTSTVTEYGYAAPTGGYAYPTGSYGPKNTTTKVWYELYEKIHEAEYAELGPSALPGYPGSGLYKDWDSKAEVNYQPYEVKEFVSGKWTEYAATATYGVPKPSATTFTKTGVYTMPEYEVTVKDTTTVPAEAHYTGKPHETVTYGGVVTTISKPATVTVPYGAYETEGTKTKTVILYKTITVTASGAYTVVEPTTTVCESSTVLSYPTASIIEPGTYTYPAATVTVTKPGEAYTASCTAHKPSSTSYPSGTASPYPEETPSTTGPSYPDPSSDYEEPAENYGTPYAGYVKRGGMLLRKAEEAAKVAKPAPGKRVILV